jgi:hypothetical protein
MTEWWWVWTLVIVAVAYWEVKKVSAARYARYVKLLEGIEHNTAQILLRIDNGHLSCRAPDDWWREELARHGDRT